MSATTSAGMCTVAAGAEASSAAEAIQRCVQKTVLMAACGAVDISVFDPVYSADRKAWTVACSARVRPDQIDGFMGRVAVLEQAKVYAQ